MRWGKAGFRPAPPPSAGRLEPISTKYRIAKAAPLLGGRGGNATRAGLQSLPRQGQGADLLFRPIVQIEADG